MKTFEVLGITPGDLAHPGIAVAMSRNGGTGVLDLAFTTNPDATRRNFLQLLDSTTGPIGLRVDPAFGDLAAELIALAGERPLTLIVAGETQTQRSLRSALGPGPSHRWLAEVTDPAQLATLEPHFDGLVARGHEAGGWVGSDSSYILLQKLARLAHKPLFVQGGIGLRAAAACRAAGASGVVLDDALLLMAESPLPAAMQSELARLNGAECKPLGELLNRGCRVYARPASAALKLSEDETRQAEAGLIEINDWAQRLQSRIGWSPDRLLPLGQGIGLAAGCRERHRSVARLVQAVRRASLQQIERAAALAPLGEHSALAGSHGTRYPVAQGPMTRVSDSPAFAAEVAKGGGLPFLALALMRGPQVREMLEQTRARIDALGGALPWGVGMLGFVPQALRDEQCAEVWACKPTFALIAGGRPDQAAEFESRGIPTYIHAPAPALLKLYLEQGARRFVFEGRECGGHVGPIASFPMWEQMIEVLLEHVPASDAKQIHVLFAGGIHDASSAAMVAAMTAPLAERGMKVGCLMGTAYLFTQEIVASGAIVPTFQDEALRCTHTLNLESGPGHASRCVDTKFARDFYDERRRLIRENRSAEDIRDALEDLNLGRLRIASKGLDRDSSGKVVVVPEDRQRSEGMYMIGQVATLRDRVQPIAELHEDVTVGAQRWLQQQLGMRADRAQSKPSDIAIVGIGVTLPGANSPDDYWELILRQRSILREAPKDRWDPALMYDPDRNARDKVYSKWGGFLDEIPFDPLKFGIPPKSMKSIDPLQLLTLETAARTLADAGYADGRFDRENTSVILGAGGGSGDLGQQYAMRAELPRFVEHLSADVWERLPEWTEESFAGTLLNVAAGRVANRLDFGGVNYTVDAACGSSLAAIGLAVHELETGRSNLVLAGGFDTTQSAFAFMAFAKTQALSPSGKPRTFDQSADGIAISEGVAMIALKRLADAERDGDRIYAVIKATAGSSDGKALGLTAPRTEGQVRALTRAYAKAGFSPATLDLVEAHGTGTPVGDRTEAETVARALRDAGAAPKRAAIGSVKTILGHTKAAAGASGLIKVALSLYHRTLPGHHGVEKPIDVVADPQAPIYLLKDARPWLTPADHPRRGAASAFGFGGTNFHAVLEEYRGSQGVAGGTRWPCELFLFRADDTDALTRDLTRIRDSIPSSSLLQPGELAQALAREADIKRGRAVALAIVATDLTTLRKDLDAVLAHLADAAKPLPPHIRLQRQLSTDSPALAFVFPGQGAQHVNMGREAAIHLDEIRSALEFAEATLRETLPEGLSARVYPPAAFDADTEAQQAAAITDTRYAQPAIGALSLGYWRFAQRMGLSAVATAGHSYGEYSALMAAGVLEPADHLRLSAVRGRAMAEASQVSQPGGMAAVQGTRDAITPLIAEFTGVRIANHNAPEQSVISGPRDAIERAVEKLSAAGLRAVMLPVSGAFHTELIAPAKTALSQAIHATRFAPARLAVFANATGQPYPVDAAAMQGQLDEHLLSSVEFVAEIEAMYAAGCRVFLELGPRGICAALVRQILADRPDAKAISLDAGMQGLKSLQSGLAELFVSGVQFDAAALYTGRELPLLDLARLRERAAVPTPAKHVWWLSGGCARAQDETERRTGKLPALTRDARDTARTQLEAQMEAAIRARLPAGAPLHAPMASHQAAAPTAMSASIASAAPINAALNSEALIAYQQTMRQFLSLQERVVQQFLGGAPAMPAATQPAATQTVFAAPVVMPSMAAPGAVSSTPLQTPAVVTQAAMPVAAPAIEIAAPCAPALDVRALLLGIVAERTGYPTEMLGLDADLEADLGIDSIKRVEILGGLRKALPETVADGVKQRMERYTKAKTLNAILAELETLTATLPAVAPAATTATATATAVQVAITTTPALDARTLLLGIVAERTGYPTEMLGLDADLEADLGIDSIKRVEILGGLRKALPEAVADGVKQRMERYTKAKTLNAILAELETLTAALPAAAPVTTTVTASAAQVTVAAAPALDLRTLLLGIVAERTGYPTEMLGLDADLEADLGIDSIKRVEILGGLRKALPDALADGVKQRMERYTKAKTLSAILSELDALAPPSAASTTTVQVTTATVDADSAPAALDFQPLLLNIVAERTGYPTEMLGLDADLEADLGIDSIKRVEILGGLRKALPDALADSVKQRMERYTKAKTLNAILGELRALTPATTAPTTTPTQAATQAPSTAANDRPLPRYVIKSRPAPLPQATVTLQGLALLLGPADEISSTLTQDLRAQGLTPVLISTTAPDALRAAIAQARTEHGAVRALVHLHGLSDAHADDLSAWRGIYQRDLLSLFHALQSTLDDVSGLRVIAASRLGGTFGRDAVGEGGPLGGGVNGILNCLRVEHPECLARAVDFDGHTDAQIVAHLKAELFADDTETEAGYIGAKRYGAATLQAALAATPFGSPLIPAGDWVLLATGGARGITAQIIETLVQPGMRLVLLGRTPEPAIEDASTARHADADALRKALLADKLARGERPRPVEIDREVSRLLVDRELRANLARLRARGAIVDYRAVDVRDEAAFGALIDELYAAHGRIDAVIHGAGVIEDKLLKDKAADSFERVLGTKLDPAFVLARKLRPESLKLISFFTSVAGRYGNRGQADYAAANEALNRLAWDLHRRWTQTRVLAINWGPWDGGMASEGIKRQLRERGMEPIPVPAGCRYFLDELANGPRHDVELVAGQGPWGELASTYAATQPAAAQAAGGSRRYAFVRKPARVGVGGAISLDHRLTLADDPWLRDHVIDGVPVVPLSVALETMAQFVAQNWEGWQIAEVRDLRMQASLTVDAESGADVQLRAKAGTHSEAGSQHITVQFGSAKRGEDPCFRATIVLREVLPTSASAQLAGLSELDPIDAAEAYAKHLCRGERLRALRRIGALAANGAVASLQPSSAAQFVAGSDADWLFDPALLDALTQLAFVWAQQHHRQGVLPQRLGRVCRYGHGPLQGPLTLVQHFVPGSTDGVLLATAEFVDAHGVLRYTVEDIESAMNAELNRLAPSSPDYVRPFIGQSS